MTLTAEFCARTGCLRDLPVLESARLVLRAPRLDDAEAIALLANDLRVSANTARLPHPYGPADAEQFIATINRRNGEAVFAILHESRLIGICGIHSHQGEAELGYWLGVSYWGRGLATEAVRAVIDHAFGELDHEVLQAGARVSNPASRRVLEKCGFQWTGVRLTRIRAINSAAPTDRFQLDRRLWQSLKSWGAVRRVA